MFGNKKKFNVLEQTQANLIKSQENLEITQKNIENFFNAKDSDSLEVQLKNVDDGQKPLEVLVRKAPDFIPKKEYHEKWKAAYALNLCTVSVSQIVEYDDIRTLEQEYSTILNNLNLQNMPKDEALLDVLKQLLNVITFFKIQEGDKEMLEKEYQHKMKNAIWSAVPNMSVILTTPDPKVMLFNLATQVGIGYMNYRKEKANTQLEQDKQKWQLKRSAMEQINGLRRELFDTAWRLSKEYNFDDHLRLTEHQIEQYNKILLDVNPARKYERLLSIQNTFKAYPPFWYYLGHTAAEIGKDDEAIGSFYEFLRLTGNKTKNHPKVEENNNLLREDHLCASCALELAGLMSYDRDEMLELLDISVKSSGNALDVLQMCAMTYISIKENDKAINVLRYLVNEGYNVDLNANLISKMYFEQILQNKPGSLNEYKELKIRKDSGVFMIDIPEIIPDGDEERKKIIDSYYNSRRKELEEKKKYIVNKFSEKTKSRFYEICQCGGNIGKDFAEFLQNLNTTITVLFDELQIKTEFKNVIIKKSHEVEQLKNFAINGMHRTEEKINEMYESYIFEGLIVAFDEILIETLLKLQNDMIFKTSYTLDSFCLNNDFPVYIKSEDSTVVNYTNEFLSVIYSEKDIQKVIKQETRKDACVSVIENYKKDLVSDTTGEKVYFVVKGDQNFGRYIAKYGDELKDILWEDDEILAVLNDKSWDDKDLIFTTKGYFLTSWKITISGSKRNRVLYTEEIGDSKKENTIKIKDYGYHNKYVNIDAVCNMIREIANKTRNL